MGRTSGGAGAGASPVAYQALLATTVTTAGLEANLASLSLPAGKYLLVGELVYSDGFDTSESLVLAVTPTSDSVSNPWVQATVYVGTNAGNHQEGHVAISVTRTLAATTTVYLTWLVAGSHCEAIGNDVNANAATGLVALQYA